MNLRSTPRSALDSYLKLLRLPADAVVKALASRGRDGETTPAELAVDRADAAVRDVLGRVFNDTELQADARRRRAAADERARALKLRATAERHSEQADENLDSRQATAEQRRKDAADREQQRKQDAEKQRAATSRQLAQVEDRKLTAVQAETQRAEEAIDDHARRERLDQLDAKTGMLKTEEEALTARSEAQRLRRAAAETKSQRKQGG